ncbi:MULTISPECIES: trypsin-like peptidase domain-containing protein [unclassified Streptomyces]|uniref:VMAP-C domain-containing protein n=1 Tax=unclassified Streptomyces TaxID=2593676 RepID=UPI002DDBDE90|nr:MULTISPECIES: trypsin-like peptidase domain-containing protein [unclassified Streptomyces]WSA92394.1 serine protease [Streptomyces sp. NBC_01795]WSB76762.1 serine protease [Streptomyces sp. NBC_01775]WSS14961.1 serine protease [Streptomyces sp. NBC_01186]WSS43805.1 serine protease [Streptomyces sp. NBC_01187]
MNAPTGFEGAVRASVVRIGAPGDGYDGSSDGSPRMFWGSGFLVAPGWVLTCAHVVGKGAAAVWRGERAIGITIGDEEVHSGELAFGLPLPEDPLTPPSPWPFPDLALVRVPGAEDADCLWLSDRSALTPAEIGLYGWMPGPVKGEPMFFSGGGTATGGSAGPVMLSGGQLTEGCSGGPVVDVRRGAVIGVSKGKGRQQGSGLATPVTALRKLCDTGPRGARVLHEVLTAHDRHHLKRYHGLGASWPRLHARLGPPAGEPAHGFTADRRAQLYALFADLEPPTGAGQVLQLANEARNLVLQSPYTLREHDPRSWREGAGLLYDPRDGRAPDDEPSRDLALEAVVLYAAKVCAALTRSGMPRSPQAARAVADLRGWVEATALTLRNDVVRARVPRVLEGHRPAVAARADVLVEIDPDIYGTGRHAWRVALLETGTAEAVGAAGSLAAAGGDFGASGEPPAAPASEAGFEAASESEPERSATTVAQSREDAPRTALEEAVRSALSLALDQCDVDEHLAAVEFMLPRALFDEPVDQWRARPYDPADPFNPHTLPLGQRRLVVLRDRLRKDHGVTPEWRARAGAVAAGPMEAVPLRRDVPGTGHDEPPAEGGQAAYGRLLAAPPGAVPVYCARTGSGPGARAMAAALAAGHAVALWRHTDSGHTDCAEFHARAAELLREAHAARQLPVRIRTLRNGNADEDAPDPTAVWARHIVLLYDPPHRAPGDGPLREPPLMHRQPTAVRSTP